MRIRLNHTCNHPHCTGQSGDVLDVADDVGHYLLKRRGCTRVADPVAEVQASEDDDGDHDELQEVVNQERHAETAPALSARERRRQRKRGRDAAKPTETDSPARSDSDETTTPDGDETDAE